jgi:glucose-1-phosphate adenylyltransferase
MNTDETGRIVEFEEKPAVPKSNLASMGIYCFSWDVLREALIKDEANPNSRNDFGANVIPGMIEAGYAVYTYAFDGYWKDVGTISSLWESNMDLLTDPSLINLRDLSWSIYSKNPQRPSHYFGPDSNVDNIAITDGSEIFGECHSTIVSYNVVVEEGAVITDSILMPGSYIEAGAVLTRCIVGMDTRVERNVRSTPDEADGLDLFVNDKLCKDGITVFAPNLVIKEGTKIVGNSMIGAEHARKYPQYVREVPHYSRMEVSL